MKNEFSEIKKQIGQVGKCPVCHQKAPKLLWLTIRDDVVKDQIAISYCGNEFCKKRIERDNK